jgi:hypothetical protein
VCGFWVAGAGARRRGRRWLHAAPKLDTAGVLKRWVGAWNRRCQCPARSASSVSAGARPDRMQDGRAEDRKDTRLARTARRDEGLQRLCLDGNPLVVRPELLWFSSHVSVSERRRLANNVQGSSAPIEDVPCGPLRIAHHEARVHNDNIPPITDERTVRVLGLSSSSEDAIRQDARSAEMTSRIERPTSP